MNEKEVKAIQTLATALGKELDRTVREKAKLEYDYQKMEDKYLQTDFMIACLEDELDKLREEKEELEDEIKRLKKAVRYYESRFPKYEEGK